MESYKKDRFICKFCNIATTHNLMKKRFKALEETSSSKQDSSSKRAGSSKHDSSSKRASSSNIKNVDPF